MQTPTRTAAYWIDRLQLTPLPEEGGMFREMYRSPMIHPQSTLPERYNGPRAAITDIFYLLHAKTFSALHRLTSDEIWHYHTGTTMLVHVIQENGTYVCHNLGLDAECGEALRITLPRGCWFAAEMKEKTDANFALVSCVVAPGFEFQDFELGERMRLQTEYPQHSAVIVRLTRS